jgi:excisionase family DNA binding protein
LLSQTEQSRTFPRGFSVVTDMEDIPSNIQILRPRKACEKLGIGRSTLYLLIAAGELRTIKLGKRAVGLYAHELDAWLASRARAA